MSTITIKSRRMMSQAWQMTLADGQGYYIGTVISPWEDVARRMAHAAAIEAERMGIVDGEPTFEPAEAATG